MSAHTISELDISVECTSVRNRTRSDSEVHRDPLPSEPENFYRSSLSRFTM